MSSSFDYDPKKLAEDQAEADSRKLWLNAYGGIADSLANIPSQADIMLGRTPQKNDAGSGFRRAADAIRDPGDQLDKKFDRFKKSSEARQIQDQDKAMASNRDPESATSKAKKLMAQKYGLQVDPAMSGYDIDQLLDAKKMNETSAKAVVDFQNAKKLKDYEHSLDIDKLKQTYSLDPKKSGAVGQFERLAPENQAVITDLAKKNANKIAIANQIEAVMSKWDELPDDQKVAQGRQLIKTLNSTEGADAVGEGEAARLGGKLEFALGNLTNSNPTQFGRDLPGFKIQADDTVKNIRAAVDKNTAKIDELYGRPSINNGNGMQINMANKDLSIQKADGKSASDPRITPDVVKYAKSHNISVEDALAIKIKRSGGG